jgi:hypothetical protein
MQLIPLAKSVATRRIGIKQERRRKQRREGKRRKMRRVMVAATMMMKINHPTHLTTTYLRMTPSSTLKLAICGHLR